MSFAASPKAQPPPVSARRWRPSAPLLQGRAANSGRNGAGTRLTGAGGTGGRGHVAAQGCDGMLHWSPMCLNWPELGVFTGLTLAFSIFWRKGGRQAGRREGVLKRAPQERPRLDDPSFDGLVDEPGRLPDVRTQLVQVGPDPTQEAAFSCRTSRALIRRDLADHARECGGSGNRGPGGYRRPTESQLVDLLPSDGHKRIVERRLVKAGSLSTSRLHDHA